MFTNQAVSADLAFYTTDAAFLLAASTLDTVFRFEKDNRDNLWKLSPDIKHTLDKIRPDAAQAVATYAAARKAYMSSPTPTGLSLLNTILAKVQQVSVAAAAAVATLPTSTK